MAAVARPHFSSPTPVSNPCLRAAPPPWMTAGQQSAPPVLLETAIDATISGRHRPRCLPGRPCQVGEPLQILCINHLPGPSPLLSRIHLPFSSSSRAPRERRLAPPPPWPTVLLPLPGSVSNLQPPRPMVDPLSRFPSPFLSPSLNLHTAAIFVPLSSASSSLVPWLTHGGARGEVED